MSDTLLIRYGLIPEVARFSSNGDGPYRRGERVVVTTHRGVEIGTVLETLRESAAPGDDTSEEVSTAAFNTMRGATADDEIDNDRNAADCRAEFDAWRDRIVGWDLELELIDLEWTLDRGKLVLYVLNERGSDCTKLAIYAAAEGLATVDVQPVNAAGLVQMEPAGGSCGSGGGCGSCGG